jgi:hypothetical protein
LYKKVGKIFKGIEKTMDLKTKKVITHLNNTKRISAVGGEAAKLPHMISDISLANFSV